MKRISLWARNHRISARFLILFLYIPFNLLAITAGEMFFALQGPLPAVIAVGSAALLFAGIVGFQAKHRGYDWRITCHRLMLAATFGLACFCASQWHAALPGAAWNSAANAASVAAVPNTSIVREARKTMKNRVARFTYRKIMKMFGAAAAQPGRPLSKGEKILFVVLSIVGGVVLTLLLAALSCSIACSGAEALSIIVLIAGAAGIAIGLTALIRHIVRSPDKEPTTPYAFRRRAFAFARRRPTPSVN